MSPILDESFYKIFTYEITLALFWYRKAGIGCICLQVSLCIRDGMPSENRDDLSLGLYKVKVIEIYQAKCIARIVILIRAVA